jgi:hypothetical protein
LIDDWSGGSAKPPSDRERSVLAADTKFLKTGYLRNNLNSVPIKVPADAPDAVRAAAASSLEEVEVSVVTSGTDMNNSIHRPERCLVDQGFSITGDKKITIKVNGKVLPLKRLVATQHVKDEKSGKIFVHKNLTYYWFTGYESLTNDHYERTFIDLKDRMFKGFAQEWAYTTVSMMVEPHVADDGKGNSPTRFVDSENEDADGLTEADKIIQEFIVGLVKEVVDRRMIKSWKDAK